jgi:hypothetical protein
MEGGGMKRFIFRLTAALAFSLIMTGALYAADAKAATLTCVGLYSETDAGYISYRVGNGSWVVVKVGDVIPANAEIKITVDRDWIEVIQTGKPNTVWELSGIDAVPMVKSVAEILKMKGRNVGFPKESAASDPKYKNKLVVKEYLGRQIYRNPDKDENDIKYGDVLENGGRVTIIAINNTLTLANDKGAVTTIIGPLKFDVEKVLTNQNLYKFLNVSK